jgi:hypothetical protein
MMEYRVFFKSLQNIIIHEKTVKIDPKTLELGTEVIRF